MLNKKVVMFGKLSQLDHIVSLRGEPIARSCGTAKRRNAKQCFADPKGKRSEVNLLNRAKMAAMFGLDARIALAIFGALSVISGAALYSALNKVDSTVLLSDLNEIGKAFEAYYLDTGQYMPRYNPTDKNDIDYHHFIGESLIKKYPGVHNWKGPYLPYDSVLYVTKDTFLKYPKTDRQLSIFHSQDVPWGNWYEHKCTSATLCYLWIGIGGFTEESAFLKLDSMIDKGDGKENGDIRWAYSSNADELWNIQYKYMPIPNPM